MALNDKDHQTTKNRTFLMSLRHAITGIVVAFNEEANLKRDLIGTLIVSFFALLFKVTLFDWLLLIIAIGLVIITEMWNTVIENVVDLITKHEFSQKAKKIKDISAGNVVIAVIFAMLIGAYVFLPYLIKLFFN